ncbi:MAG: hypothetical protein WCS52_16365 [bacterium]
MFRNYSIIVVSVVFLLMTSLAFYYRSQAAHVQRQYSAALDQLDQMAAAARVVPVPAVEPGATGHRLPPSPESQAGVTAVPEAVAGVLPPAPKPPDRGRHGSPESWMEAFRTNDPPRYAEFQQRRQEMQQRMQAAWNQSSNYFMSRDTSKMPQAEFEEYNTMTLLLSQAASLNQQLQSGLPPEVRQQVASELRSNIVAVAPLLENERNREYFDAAVAMGQSEQDAATMVAYINQITSNTSMRAILPGMRMGGRGRD